MQTSFTARRLVIGAIGTVLLVVAVFAARRSRPTGAIAGASSAAPAVVVASVGSGLDLGAASALEDGFWPATAQRPTSDVAGNEVRSILAAFRALPLSSARSSFDVSAHAAGQGADPETSFLFVRDRIRNEIYPGVLRGASGTLQAGAGNDLDKAVLLAALLGPSNFPVRYAGCTLSVQQAEQQVAAVLHAQAPPVSTDVDISDALQSALEQSGLSRGRAADVVKKRLAARAWLDGEIFRTARADLVTLRSALDKAGIRPSPVADQSVVRDATAHYWLQVQRNGSWQDLDATVPDARPGTAVCAAAQTWADLPESAYQKIGIAVRNESVHDGALTSEVVLTHEFRASDLYGRIISFTNVGLGSASTLTAGTRVERMVPFLWTDDVTVPGSEFATVPPGAAGSPGGMMGDALSGDAPPPALAAQWLEFRLQAPGRELTIKRAVADLIAPRERTSGAIQSQPDSNVLVAMLSQGFEIAITSGPVASVAAMQAALGGTELEALGQGPPRDASSDSAPSDAAAAARAAWVKLSTLSYACAVERALVTLSQRTGPNVRLVRDQPMLTIGNHALRRHAHDKGFDSEVWLDLRHNVIRVIADSAAHSSAAFWANVLHGLVGGAVERHLSIGEVGGSEGTRREEFDTSSTIERARDQKAGIIAVAGASAAARLRDEFSEVGGDRIAAEMTDGVAIVAPSRPVEVAGEPRFAAWSLDTRSGHLVALLDTGIHGDAASERAALEAQLKELEMLVRQCVASPARAAECRRLLAMYKRVGQALADHVSNYPWSTPIPFNVEVIYFF